MTVRLLTVDDGRSIEVVDSGPRGAPTVVFHSGTPCGLVPFAPLFDGARDRGLRVVTALRPGYGRSSTKHGRDIAAVASDTHAVADALGVDSYVAVGHSGGGPHALACRALDVPRCRGAITIAGLAPYGVDGLDFLDGMGDDNVDEFRAALAGEPTLSSFLTTFAAALADISAEGLTDVLGSLLPAVDRVHLANGMADFFAAALRTGVAAGIDGWRDDDLAFIAPWGFEISGLTNISIWQGSDDLMVPFAHGRFLAEAISAASSHLLDREGHLSVVAGRFGEVLDEAVGMLR